MWSVKDKLDSGILILKPTDTVLVAKDLLMDQQLFQLPVVEQGKISYEVSLESLSELPDDLVLSDIEEIQNKDYLHAQPEQHFFQALQMIIDHSKSLSVSVVDKKGLYVGIVRLKDLATNYVPPNYLTQQASLIVLEMDEHEYSLTNIANIVEYNRCKILQSLIVGVEDRKLWVQLIVNSTTIQSTLEGFERYGYSIIYTENQMDGGSPLEDRYKSLLKYLDL